MSGVAPVCLFRVITRAYNDKMLSLTTLGGLAVADAAGVALPVPRRQLALITLLAVSGDRGLRRDQLLAYLWPESPSESARHSLDQLLYVARRQLDGALFSGSDPLHLNGAAISSDLKTFEEAFARGDYRDAVASYGGPFLAGFFVSDSPGFEEWVESQRSRLARAYLEALERLARLDTERGHHTAAVEWWRRFVANDPLSERGTLGLLRALAAAGERTAALQHATAYQKLVKEELESPPNPEVAALERKLRLDPGVPAQVGDYVIEPDASAKASLPPQSEARRSGSTEVITGAAPLSHRRSLLIPIASVVAVMVIAWTWLMGGREQPSLDPVLDPNRILVVPFRVSSGDPSLVGLREGMVDLLAARLTGEGGPAAVDSRSALHAWREAAVASGKDDLTQEATARLARALGAGQILLGEVVATPPDQLRLSGRVVSSSDGRVGPSTSVTGAADSLLTLADRLASQLLVLHAEEDPQRIAALSVLAPAALGAFLEGRAQVRLGHGVAARRAFARALEQDSTFALAALELAAAAEFVFQWAQPTRVVGISLGSGGLTALSDQDQWNRALEIAWLERDRLAPPDRALLVALRGQRSPDASDASEMLAGWDGAVRAAPARADVHYGLGYVLLQQGLAMGLVDSRRRAAASFRAALARDPAFVKPLAGLIEIAALEHDTRALRELKSVYLARDSVGDDPDFVRWLVASVTEDEAELRSLRSRFEGLAPETLDRIQRISQVAGVRLEDGELATSVILERANEREERRIALHRAVGLALNRGRPDEAMRLMDAKRDVDLADEYEQFALRYALMWDGDASAGDRAARVFEENLAAAPGNGRPQWYFSLALWRAWHGDTTGVAGTIARLRKVSPPLPPFGQAEVLEALLAAMTRTDAPAALAALDSLALRGCCSLPRFINLVSARLHEGAGDLSGALTAVRRQRWLYPPEFLSTALREEGRLASLTGDRQGAIRAYRHYLTLRSSPEPGLRAEVERVRDELRRLERTR